MSWSKFLGLKRKAWGVDHPVDVAAQGSASSAAWQSAAWQSAAAWQSTGWHTASAQAAELHAVQSALQQERRNRGG